MCRSREKDGNREKERNKKGSSDHSRDRDRDRDRDRERSKESGRIRKDSGSNVTPTSGQQRMRDGNTPNTPIRNAGQPSPYAPRHEFMPGGDGRPNTGSHSRHSGPNQNDVGDRWSGGQPRDR